MVAAVLLPPCYSVLTWLAHSARVSVSDIVCCLSYVAASAGSVPPCLTSCFFMTPTGGRQERRRNCPPNLSHMLGFFRFRPACRPTERPMSCVARLATSLSLFALFGRALPTGTFVPSKSIDFVGSLDAVNLALSEIGYRGDEHWYGKKKPECHVCFCHEKKASSRSRQAGCRSRLSVVDVVAAPKRNGR